MGFGIGGKMKRSFIALAVAALTIFSLSTTALAAAGIDEAGCRGVFIDAVPDMALSQGSSIQAFL
jgi:hypothetical protein